MECTSHTPGPLFFPSLWPLLSLKGVELLLLEAARGEFLMSSRTWRNFSSFTKHSCSFISISWARYSNFSLSLATRPWICSYDKSRHITMLFLRLNGCCMESNNRQTSTILRCWLQCISENHWFDKYLSFTLVRVQLWLQMSDLQKHTPSTSTVHFKCTCTCTCKYIHVLLVTLIFYLCVSLPDASGY